MSDAHTAVTAPCSQCERVAGDGDFYGFFYGKLELLKNRAHDESRERIHPLKVYVIYVCGDCARRMAKRRLLWMGLWFLLAALLLIPAIIGLARNTESGYISLLLIAAGALLYPLWTILTVVLQMKNGHFDAVVNMRLRKAWKRLKKEGWDQHWQPLEFRSLYPNQAKEANDLAEKARRRVQLGQE